MTATRRKPIDWPHLSTTEPIKRHDLGDEIARRHGVWTVITACGRDDVSTTMATKRRDAVRCPACLAA